ncbi:hypothetical protein J41TS4_39430 [Paenibacillus apis]|uniref:Uncharacterized protein n=1 Tax=Paenibacillus apis TaxID=1792174 RepID=A0A920CM80_9BACL|nr:transposase [Paenibacillus apis]GIO44185.1 hypothetical protein J41TS4_39430 [Paenibacillus apis]
MDLEEDIPANHLVRVVDTAVNRLDDAIFDVASPGGGRDIMFMWIAGRQRPDFRTTNRFRSERMKTVLETVFTVVHQFLP